MVAHDAFRHFDASALPANRAGRLTPEQVSTMRRRIGVRGLVLGVAFIAAALLLLVVGVAHADQYPALRVGGMLCAVPGMGIGVMFLIGAALGGRAGKRAQCHAIAGPLRVYRIELRDTEGNVSYRHRLSIGDIEFRIAKGQYFSLRHRNGSHSTGYRAGRGGTLVNMENSEPSA